MCHFKCSELSAASGGYLFCLSCLPYKLNLLAFFIAKEMKRWNQLRFIKCANGGLYNKGKTVT